MIKRLASPSQGWRTFDANRRHEPIRGSERHFRTALRVYHRQPRPQEPPLDLNVTPHRGALARQITAEGSSACCRGRYPRVDLLGAPKTAPPFRDERISVVGSGIAAQATAFLEHAKAVSALPAAGDRASVAGWARGLEAADQ